MKTAPCVGARYRLEAKVGEGNFGAIYQGTDIHTGSQVAAKVENLKAGNPKLLYEAKIYRLLEGGPGIASVNWYGCEGGCNVMVMDLLGPSLADLQGHRGKCFSLKSVLLIVDQLLGTLEFLHSKNLLHRDLKPENILTGRGKAIGKIFVIDFGLSKKYRDFKTLQHVPYSENKGLSGTPRFASLNAHAGCEQSRRDDLESLGYVLVSLVRGGLPWQTSLPGLEKPQDIMDMKKTIAPEKLCEGLPQEFATYMTYCRNLHFGSAPDYKYLRGLFKELLAREGYENDSIIDWALLEQKKSSTSGGSKETASTEEPAEVEAPSESHTPSGGAKNYILY